MPDEQQPAPDAAKPLREALENQSLTVGLARFYLPAVLNELDTLRAETAWLRELYGKAVNLASDCFAESVNTHVDDGWRRIDAEKPGTWPEEGVHVLLRFDWVGKVSGAEQQMIRLEPKRKTWCVEGYRIGSIWLTDCPLGLAEVADPTHWQSLPAQPADERSGTCPPPMT